MQTEGYGGREADCGAPHGSDQPFFWGGAIQNQTSFDNDSSRSRRTIHNWSRPWNHGEWEDASTSFMKWFTLFALVWFISSVAVADPIPNPDLTPGKISDATQEQVCKVGFTKDSRHVTQKMKDEVFKRYGFISGQFKPGDYEIDHFISLELGGANDVENLWPQPYAGDHGARKKDVIETHFHREICKGHMTLKDAQDRIRADWVKEYELWKSKRHKK